MTSQEIRSPQSIRPPLTGPSKTTCGRVLPTTTGIVVVPVFPASSVTVRRTVYPPGVVYWNVGLAAVESTVPSSWKSHANVSAEPSGSLDAAEENVTVSGSCPLSGVAVARATGRREPLM